MRGRLVACVGLMGRIGPMRQIFAPVHRSDGAFNGGSMDGRADSSQRRQAQSFQHGAQWKGLPVSKALSLAPHRSLWRFAFLTSARSEWRARAAFALVLSNLIFATQPRPGTWNEQR